MIDRAVDDDVIMGRLQSGDPSAFEELFRLYYRHVFCIAAAIIGDTGRAEELTQSIFLGLWVTPGAFRTGSLAAWLTRVSRNRAIDELRRRRFTTELPNCVSDEPTPYDRVSTLLVAQRLHAAVEALAVEHRSLIELSYFAGLTHVQIAQRTSVPLGTVKTRLRAGLRALSVTLSDLRLSAC